MPLLQENAENVDPTENEIDNPLLLCDNVSVFELLRLKRKPWRWSRPELRPGVVFGNEAAFLIEKGTEYSDLGWSR